MAVFFPSAEYLVTTRITSGAGQVQDRRQVLLVKPGWLAIYGKEAPDEVADAKDGDKGQNLVAVQPGETVAHRCRGCQGPQDPPAGTLLRSHAAGPWKAPASWIEDEELREAMQEKGLGTRHACSHHRRPDRRKYMLREAANSFPRPRPSS